MQFVNIAVVLALIQFAGLDKPLFGFLPLLSGEIRGFDAKFYYVIGITMTATLINQLIIPRITGLRVPIT